MANLFLVFNNLKDAEKITQKCADLREAAELAADYKFFIREGLDHEWALTALEGRFGLDQEKIRGIINSVKLTNETPKKI